MIWKLACLILGLSVASLPFLAGMKSEDPILVVFSGVILLIAAMFAFLLEDSHEPS